MPNIYESAEQLIGRTPLVRLSRLESLCGLNARLIAKLEYLNPAGSVKDRAAKAMIDDAEKRNALAPGGTIIEPTSGNTGIGLAAVGVPRGYRVVIVMPDSMSVERIRLMEAYGAEVVLSPGAEGMSGAIRAARELAAKTLNSFIPDQFSNSANARIHFETTGPELWEDTGGQIDLFVAGVGTGGTITGVSRFLRSKKPDIRIIAAEPKGSPVLSGGKAGPHGLQGIGAGFVPDVLDTAAYDEIVTVTEAQAYAAAGELARREGILAGISSGAALHAAIEQAKRPENNGRTIVALLPDTGDRYLSTALFSGK